jgi:hypothetical protein
MRKGCLTGTAVEETDRVVLVGHEGVSRSNFAGIVTGCDGRFRSVSLYVAMNFPHVS